MSKSWKCWRDPSHQQVEITGYGWPQCAICHAAPAYHDRWAYARTQDITLSLFVPVAGTDAARRIAARSGIVGVLYQGDRIDTYYEGWIYSPPSDDVHENWRRAVESAAGRLVTAYPTVARSLFPADSLIRIGHLNVRDGITVDDPAALEAWLTA